MADGYAGAPGRGRPLADFNADRRLIALSGLAIVVGAGGAGAAWLLLKLIAVATNLIWFGRLDVVARPMVEAHRGPWMVAAPALGGIFVGLLARFGSEKIRGHGIPEAIEAILIGGSRMSAKVAVLKPLSSAIAIGSGGPFGAEGPIIMTGGALGSLFAQHFHLSSSERKTLLVAGAAAGMTAIFGTPTAAVLLAVELLLFEWRPRSFIPVTVAAVTALCWRPVLLGSGPLFPIQAALPQGAWALPAAAGVGVMLGLLSGGLTKLLYLAEDGFARLPIHWMWWPAIGGLAVGAGGLLEPRALGVGYDVIADLLSGHMAARAVVLVLFVKASIWLVSLASGTSGGVLAPLLILGGAAGWLIGLVLPGPPGLWALVGMAAILGGTMRAPLTGAVFAVELTGELRVLPAVLAAAAAGHAVTVLLMKRSILTEKIARRGRHITREYGVDPHELTQVREVMVQEVEVLSADIRVSDAVGVIEKGHHRTYPVVDREGRPIGMFSRADALRLQVEGVAEDVPLTAVLRRTVTPVHPDDVTARVIELMLESDFGRVPVVDPQTGRLVGLITRKDLLEVRAGALRLERERAATLGRRRVRAAA